MRTHALSIRPACPTFATDPEGALAEYHQRGFHVEPDVWTREERDALLRAARALRARSQAAGGLIPSPHRLHEAFLRAMRRTRLVIIMRDVVAGNVSGLGSELLLGEPGARALAPHQDNFYVEAPRDAFATAWTALEDVAPESGGLYVFPGSHAEALLPVESVPENCPPCGGMPSVICQRALVPARYARIDLKVPAGAIVVLHGHVVHGWSENRSDRIGPSLLLRYVRRNAHFRPGRHADRAEIEVEV